MQTSQQRQTNEILNDAEWDKVYGNMISKLRSKCDAGITFQYRDLGIKISAFL